MRATIIELTLLAIAGTVPFLLAVWSSAQSDAYAACLKTHSADTCHHTLR